MSKKPKSKTKSKPMKRFFVHFKNRKEEVHQGYSYTERDGRLYFHQKEDKSDFEFFTSAEGLEKITDTEPPFQIYM